MVQNNLRKPGRPRAYDPDEVLNAALGTFWEKGYSGTTFDELAAAMGMNKPSIYAGFGGKKALYLKALERYLQSGRSSVNARLASHETLRAGLRAIAFNAIDNYLDGEHGARGCFMVSTAVPEAPGDPDIREAVMGSFEELDTVLAARFATAQKEGEKTLDVPPEILGRMAADAIYGLALRARAGVSRANLRRSIDRTIAILCGEGPKRLVARRSPD